RTPREAHQLDRRREPRWPAADDHHIHVDGILVGGLLHDHAVAGERRLMMAGNEAGGHGRAGAGWVVDDGWAAAIGTSIGRPRARPGFVSRRMAAAGVRSAAAAFARADPRPDAHKGRPQANNPASGGTGRGVGVRAGTRPAPTAGGRSAPTSY